MEQSFKEKAIEVLARYGLEATDAVISELYEGFQLSKLTDNPYSTEEEELLLLLHMCEDIEIKGTIRHPLGQFIKSQAHKVFLSDYKARLEELIKQSYFKRFSNKEEINYDNLAEHIRLKKMMMKNAIFNRNEAHGAMAHQAIGILNNVQDFKRMTQTKRYSIIYDLMQPLISTIPQKDLSIMVEREKRDEVKNWLKAFKQSL